MDGASPLSVTYAANGNITNKSDIGNYTYNPADKPYAVREIDAIENVVGNNISLSSNSVSYALSGKPDWIYEYSYSYGPDDEKWSSWGWSPDDVDLEWDVQRTYWGDYERLTIGNHIREYYFLDNDVIIMI